jgi:hypothetical protein
MTKKLFDYDPITNTTKWWHYDAASDTAVIESQVDVSPIIEDNRRQYNAIDENARWGEMSRVASIPMSVYFDLMKQGIVDDPKAMKKWLNDPANRYYRTRPGEV